MTNPSPGAPPAPESGPPTEASQELDLLRGLMAQRDQIRASQQAQQTEAARRQQAEMDELRRQASHWRTVAEQSQTVPAAAVATPAATPAQHTSAEKRRKPTAIVSGATVDRTAISVLQYGAFGLLAISVVGSVVAFNSGWPLRSGWQPIIAAWPRPWEGVAPFAAVAGVLMQSWLTLVQWYKRRQKRSLLYLSHLGIDAGLTWGGYYPILGPFFAAGLAKLDMPRPWDTLIAVVVVAVLAIIVAKIPEEMLVDD